MGAFVSPWPALVPDSHAWEVFAITTVLGVGCGLAACMRSRGLAGPNPNDAVQLVQINYVPPDTVAKAVNGPRSGRRTRWREG